MTKEKIKLNKNGYSIPELYIPTKEDYERVAAILNRKLKTKRVVSYETAYPKNYK